MRLVQVTLAAILAAILAATTECRQWKQVGRIIDARPADANDAGRDDEPQRGSSRSGVWLRKSQTTSGPQVRTSAEPRSPKHLTSAAAAAAEARASQSGKLAATTRSKSAAIDHQGGRLLANGRKFDQVKPVECVQRGFFRQVEADLASIRPDSSMGDSYATYYDYELAKAVLSIADSPAASRQGSLLHQVAALWNATSAAYLARRRAQLEAAADRRWPSREQVRGRLATGHQQQAEAATEPPVREQLANSRSLLAHLEELKWLLASGEQALIVLNKQVKRLQVAPGERELRAAVCNCVSSRSGRAAMMLMNELFVDRWAAGPPTQSALVRAKQRGVAAAKDAAEFCSFWYGDTAGAALGQREQSLRRLLQQLEAGSKGRRRHLSDERRQVAERVLEGARQLGQLWRPQLARELAGSRPAGMRQGSTTDTPTSREPSPGRRRRQVHHWKGPEATLSSPFDSATNYGDLDEVGEHTFAMDEEEGWQGGRVRRWAAAGVRDHQSSSATNKRQDDESPFESRLAEEAAECAQRGFSELLRVALEQNRLMYELETNATIDAAHPIVTAFGEPFARSFAQLWRTHRDIWARSQSDDHGKGQLQSNEPASYGSSYGSSYERGARLGYTIGEFVGCKTASQWPDAAELNTFTYDSVFLGGVALGQSESRSEELERQVVAGAARGLAFSEGSRAAFASGLTSAYLNGAYLVPQWGLFHAQRATVQRASREASRAAGEAASRACRDRLLPAASKFLASHQHQRELAAPYRWRRGSADNRLGGPPESPLAKLADQVPQDQWAGLADQVRQVRLDSELAANVSGLASECAAQTGSLMGAALALLVVPEAFDAYLRSRGSLESLENEFNLFKLGAERGYELGDLSARLNCTAQLRRTLARKSPAPAAPAAPALRLPSGNGDHDDQANMDNVLQFMVLNYGGPMRLASHSRAHLLKLRPPSMDDELLEEMKLQTGDVALFPEADQSQQQQQATSERESLATGHLDGELELVSQSTKRQRVPLHLHSVDLGGRLELADDDQPSDSSSAGSGSPIDPVTAALAKVARLFVKLGVQVDEQKQQQQQQQPASEQSEAHNEQVLDSMASYLNSLDAEPGDGYLSGRFGATGSRLGAPDGDEEQPVGKEELDFEWVILSELFRRIETTGEEELQEATPTRKPTQPTQTTSE